MAVDASVDPSRLPAPPRIKIRLQALRHPRARPTWMAGVLILPALVVLGCVLFYPIGLAIYSGFFDIKLMNLGRPTFVGWENYRTMLRTPAFWVAVRTTVIYT